jgi:hypothetical protein
MSQLFVRIATPAAGAEVPRSIEVTGTTSVQFSPKHGPLTSQSVSVQFGTGGPSVNATFTSATAWRCVGLPSAPPGATININVSASGTVRVLTIPGEPDIEDVSAFASVTVRIANPAPQLSIDGLPGDPTDVTATQLPYPFTLSGSTSDPDANVTLVQCALDTGTYEPATNVSGNWSRWQKTYSLGAGLHRFTVQAVDLGGNRPTQVRYLMVHPQVDTPDPGTASITSWTRLESHCRNTDMGRSNSARAFDPLWLLARQWQVGEFQAADAGTPVQARLRATSAMLSRCHLGELKANTNAQAPRYDPSSMPLETMVERRRMRPVDPNDPSMLPLAVEAGLHFLRMLELQAPSTSYRGAFIGKFALQPLAPAVAAAADGATQRFMLGMVWRAPDARRLAAAFRPAGGIDTVVQDPTMKIVTGDHAKVQTAATAWLAWYDGLFAEPASPADDAWMSSRLEYAVTVSGCFSDQPLDQINLAVSAFDGGRLDWSSFDGDFEVNMVSNGDHTFSSVVETVIPAPVSFPGAPAVRFWELEDSRLAYGLVPVGPTDLAHMMMIEYASSYGNDWFVIPLTLPVGSINRVDSLVVTDSFGVRTLIKPIGAYGVPARGFSMWQHAYLRRPGNPPVPGQTANLFFLSPAVGQVMESTALEDVLLMRDEMANVAWAIESSIENLVEQPRIYREPPPAQADAAPASADAAPRYVLSSTVPGNWIPLLPVQLSDQGNIILRLKRGAMLQIDGPPITHHAQGQALNAGGDLLLYDASVPREGLHVTRARRTSRWIDGSTFVWTAFRKQVGRGEGSSGLRFDQLVGGSGTQP